MIWVRGQRAHRGRGKGAQRQEMGAQQGRRGCVQNKSIVVQTANMSMRRCVVFVLPRRHSKHVHTDQQQVEK